MSEWKERVQKFARIFLTAEITAVYNAIFVNAVLHDKTQASASHFHAFEDKVGRCATAWFADDRQTD